MNKPGKGTIPIKTHKSIWDNYNLLKNKQYTEKHIKELLIDLRFVANHVKKSFENSPYENDMNEFIDFCNFIAHPVKHRGFMVNRIVANIDLLQQSLMDPSEYIVSEYGDLYFDQLKTYPVGKYVQYIFTILFITLKGDTTEEELTRVSVSEEKDVSLCILSLLQTSILELDKKDVDKAFLILNSNNEFLNLYSVIYSEKINNQLMESGFNPLADSSLFLVPAATSSITHIKVHQTNKDNPRFYETYRDNTGKLKLRLI